MPQIVSVAMPVLAAKQEGGKIWIEDLYGTAFPLARDLILTADHVVNNVQAVAPEFGIGWGSPGDTHEHGHQVLLTLAAVAQSAGQKSISRPCASRRPWETRQRGT